MIQQLFLELTCPSNSAKYTESVLRALNRARCRRCGRCRSFLVSHWILSICGPIGGCITLSTDTCHTSPLFETLSTGIRRRPLDLTETKMALQENELSELGNWKIKLTLWKYCCFCCQEKWIILKSSTFFGPMRFGGCFSMSDGWLTNVFIF